MKIKVEIITLPSAWVSYLVNADASGLQDGEQEYIDAYMAAEYPDWDIVDVKRDEDGDGQEPRFTWSYRIYGGQFNGGEVLDYVAHSDKEAA